MIYYVNGIPYSDELYHSGVLGQKWGIRRYQNEDGTLTALGRIHYGYKSATEAVGKAAKATGRAVGKAAKTAAKYEVDKFKRNHPYLMTNEELDAQILKAKKVNDLRTTRESARGKTFVGKLSNTLWKSVGIGTDKLAENFGSNLGRKYVEDVLFKSEEEKQAKKITDKMNLMDKQESMYKKKTQDKLGDARKEYYNHVREQSAERTAATKEAASKAKDTGRRLIESGKNAYTKVTTPKIGSAKAVDEYAKQKAYEEEKERRRKLYGPGGTAYR